MGYEQKADLNDIFSCAYLCYLWDRRNTEWNLKYYPCIPCSQRALACIGQSVLLASLGIGQVLVQRTFCQIWWSWRVRCDRQRGLESFIFFFFPDLVAGQKETRYPCFPASFISMESWVFDIYLISDEVKSSLIQRFREVFLTKLQIHLLAVCF